MDYETFAIDIREENSFINRIDSELLNCDITDSIHIDIDNEQLKGITYEDDNIIKLRRTKNISKKVHDTDVIPQNNTTPKWKNMIGFGNGIANANAKCCSYFYWMLPELPPITSTNMKSMAWKTVLYLLLVYFLRKIVIEVKCF
jgi:hypothetical protein